mmetsp:Transcript_36617/g.85872  ORF Transcript_36617/g.85872 Transcript_36617/m.85872 type:complete len:211 (-) Transcript_36617:1115-1747(-)
MSSSRTLKTGRLCLCCWIDRVFANSDWASVFWFFKAWPYWLLALWSNSSSETSSSCLSVSVFFLTPITLPMLEPASSQKRCRNLLWSCSSRTCLTTFEPCLQKTAMSDVGSLTALTASVCVVKTFRPSRNGGVVSRTTTATRFSSSSFEKSKFTSFRSAKPIAPSLLSSQSSLASFFCCCRMFTRATEANWRFFFSSFSASCTGSIASMP